MTCCVPSTATIADRHSNLEYYRCCCSRYKVTAIAKPAALISGVLYVFYVLLYVGFYSWLTVFPVLLGLFMYWTLYIGIFHRRHLMLLPYMVFEVISIIGYFMLLIWLSLFVMAATQLSEESRTSIEHSVPTPHINFGYVIFLIFSTVFGIGLKAWLFSVMLALYRFLRFKEAHGDLVYAQYVNGGVHINAGSDLYPYPPPPFTATPNGPTPQFNAAFNGYDYPPLPSYETAMSTEKNGPLPA
ncbi:unnamed protein product [Toxocara canis]|uniref:Uncharacterized protein n=1 Tax=Toxocara canis TaxID=6265 RepID=A0A183ULE5_TOXCA|nr:unnamed protein product [Toxocara canis]